MYKIEQNNSYFIKNELLRCPICHTGLRCHEEKMLLCGNGHCYDIAHKGYVNFVPNQRATKYSKELFLSRRLVFQAGLFLGLSDYVIDILLHSFREAEGKHILDAGCGEGYYARRLAQALPSAHVCAMDIEKQAIYIADRTACTVFYMIGDNTNIPLKDLSLHGICNIFTPSNYSEFLRVLMPGGTLVKVVAGERHMWQIREALNIKNKIDNQVNKLFIEYFPNAMQREYEQTLPAGEEITDHLYKMSPLLFGQTADHAAYNTIKEITLHAKILVGNKHSRE